MSVTEKFAKLPQLDHEQPRVAEAVIQLDAWLESMRQSGGYGGPVTHWWNHCLVFAGPAIDWRYEGVIGAYRILYEKTGDQLWRERLKQAVSDVMAGQLPDGSFQCSRFELNPGTLGTPHEAAATLGILLAFPALKDERIITVAKKNIDHLVKQLWDKNAHGFNDRPDFSGRVPNKLATFAEALLAFYAITGNDVYQQYAENALDSVLSYQVDRGPYEGAIHQYGKGAGIGDGKYFPYYNARCIPPLIKGALFLNHSRYVDGAQAILRFLRGSMNDDGSWPQIVYHNGSRAEYPHWLSGTADILRAFRLMGEPVPNVAFERLLNAQLRSGGFQTAEGFLRRPSISRKSHSICLHDIIPVVGWNDKVFRFLSELLPERVALAQAVFEETRETVLEGEYVESQKVMEVIGPNEQRVYHWDKNRPWAECSVQLLS